MLHMFIRLCRVAVTAIAWSSVCMMIWCCVIPLQFHCMRVGLRVLFDLLLEFIMMYCFSFLFVSVIIWFFCLNSFWKVKTVFISAVYFGRVDTFSRSRLVDDRAWSILDCVENSYLLQFSSRFRLSNLYKYGGIDDQWEFYWWFSFGGISLSLFFGDFTLVVNWLFF